MNLGARELRGTSLEELTISESTHRVISNKAGCMELLSGVVGRPGNTL